VGKGVGEVVEVGVGDFGVGVEVGLKIVGVGLKTGVGDGIGVEVGKTWQPLSA
jgi:hypothetical protein